VAPDLGALNGTSGAGASLRLGCTRTKKPVGGRAVSPSDFGPSTARHSIYRGGLRMDHCNISPRELYARVGSEAAPVIVDVRRDADFAAAATLVVGAFHRSPETIEKWRALIGGRPVVTYCMHGGETSPQVAEALRRMGVKAHFLEGGIAAWVNGGLPTQRKIAS